MTPEFWNGRRVFVTGHTGFKGGWLSLWLQKLGAHVSGYSLPPPTVPNFYSASGLHQSIKSTIGDIRDIENLASAVKDAQPEIVFHLAAQPLVRLSYQDPVGTYATNVMGSIHLLEAVRQCPAVRAAVMVTSDKCYENREWEWGYRENEPMGGFDPYSNSKGCSELVVSAYRKSFFNSLNYADHRVAVASGRAGNVIGGGDWAEDRLVPDFIRAVNAGQTLLIRAPHAIRPWQHVLEPLSGYIALAEKLHRSGPEFAEGWNFGPNDQDARPVSWLVERLVGLWGEDAKWCIQDMVHPHEAHYLKLDVSKAKMRINWQPRWSIEEALTYSVEWYKAHGAGEEMREVSLRQIEAYTNVTT